MKRITIVCTLSIAVIFAKAQNELDKNIVSLNIESGKISIKQLQSLVNEMGNHQIVGLGEGTHGTKEFNDLRIDIVKELVEKKGFRIICFENAFGDSYYFNRFINSKENIKIGMKKYLISLWQTKEIEMLFKWIRKFNQEHSNKIMFTGMDFNYMENTAKIIKNELLHSNNQTLLNLSDTLIACTHYYDSIWTVQNDTTLNINYDAVFAKMRKGYSVSQKIDSLVKAENIDVNDTFKTAVLNCKFWIVGEENRDKGMAEMAVNIAKNNKMIVWAHAIHLALKSAFQDNSVGGCGGYIKQQIPDYFVLGTGTANGTYSGTPERFDTHINPMFSYPLPTVKENTWDKYFADKNQPASFINFDKVKNDTTKLPLRMVGYGTPEGIGYSDKTNLPQLFDAYIFIKTTHAANHDL
ncbi:hypothetical protein A9P82_05270 [Arachidicoccus ginsenosidimutans]|uniref:erythromycin esterase family protein n=1 Tax=Arachidicoccus sp. BS20 TaxID=1850526 RepID=UPI0007F04F9F|nr:erythromycin esterase family protein [Arachidicoccus sp. BS20]ANI88746.1 hypothetical protein A9P82_05270 [Arachidicoccus sp. BS20]